MSYSRKQLEALGEPFGESATSLKPGGRIYGGGGGGGDSTQTQISELPEWARPYAQKVLGQAEAVSSQPYSRYPGDRLQGCTPLQTQVHDRIKAMGPAGQIGAASNLAGFAGAAAFNAGRYDPGSFTGGTFDGGAANQYMSPFMEAALNPQLREAQRTSEIQRTQQAGQAVQSGAFGGGRAAILEAERQRNLDTQRGDIRARGYQSAFEQAQNQFNQDQQRRMQAAQLGEQSRQFGAGLGIQGLNTALSAAGQLGQLGQMQFGQEKDIVGLQREVGKEQRDLLQSKLTQDYQDFMDERNNPYKQLGFMSDLIRGLPLGQQSTRQIYEGSPSALQTLGSIGAGAYGMKQLGMFAEGGSVTSDEFVESSLEKMSDQQLAQAERVAMARNDRERLAMIAEEKAMRASERRGLAGGFNQIPQQMQQQMLQAARGGIVALSEGGLPPDEEIAKRLKSGVGFLSLRSSILGPRPQSKNSQALVEYMQKERDLNAAIGRVQNLLRTGAVPQTSAAAPAAAPAAGETPAPAAAPIQDPFTAYLGDPTAVFGGVSEQAAPAPEQPFASAAAGEATTPAEPADEPRTIADIISNAQAAVRGIGERAAPSFNYADPTSYLESAAAMRSEQFDPAKFETEAGQFREAAARFRGGLSELAPYEQRLKEQREGLAGRRQENKGLIALAAAQALSKRSGLRRGLGDMFGAIGTTAGSLNKELRDSERLIDQSELALAQARQARKDGNDTLAIQFTEKARADRNAATALDREVQLKAAAAADAERREERKSADDYRRTQLTVAGGIAQQIIAGDSRITAAEARNLGAPMVQLAATLVPGIMRANPELSREEALSRASERILEAQNMGSGGAQNINAFLDDFKARRAAGDPALKGKSDTALRVMAIRENANVQGKVGGDVTTETRLQNAFAKDPQLKEISEARAILRLQQSSAEVRAKIEALDREEETRKDRIRREVTGAGVTMTRADIQTTLARLKARDPSVTEADVIKKARESGYTIVD